MLQKLEFFDKEHSTLVDPHVRVAEQELPALLVVGIGNPEMGLISQMYQI